MDKDKQIASYPLVALSAVNEAGMFSRLSDYLKRKF